MLSVCLHYVLDSGRLLPWPKKLPLVTDLETDPFDLIHVGDRVRMDGDRGLIKVLGQAGA